MLITSVCLQWNAEGRTGVMEEASIGNGDQHNTAPPSIFIYFYRYLCTHMFQTASSDFHDSLTIHFLGSSLCFFHNACCFEHSNLLYIYLTLWFVQGRCVLYNFLYTDSSRYHMYKTCAL